MASDSPTLALDVYLVSGKDVWPLFAPHHYMTAKYTGHRAFLAVLPDGSPVAFTSIIAFPHGHIKKGWRGHRTVVLPDYQGLGIGARLSDWVAEYVVSVMGGRYFSRTVHPRLGAFRDASPNWRATSSNRKVQAKLPERGMSATALNRMSYSHEYVGSEDPKS